MYSKKNYIFTSSVTIFVHPLWANKNSSFPGSCSLSKRDPILRRRLAETLMLASRRLLRFSTTFLTASRVAEDKTRGSSDFKRKEWSGSVSSWNEEENFLNFKFVCCVMKRKVRHYYGRTLFKAKTRASYSRISIHSRSDLCLTILNKMKHR